MLRLDIRWGMAMALMVFALAVDARGQRLLETDGVELRGEAQLVMSGSGTCNVLETAGAPGTPAPAPAATAEQENLFWQSIMDSTNLADFEAYLAQFPNGVFRPLAQAGLAVPRAPAGDSPQWAGS